MSELDSSISGLHGCSSGDELSDSGCIESGAENGTLLLDRSSLQSALEDGAACKQCSGPLSLREDPGIKLGLYILIFIVNNATMKLTLVLPLLKVEAELNLSIDVSP